MTSSDELDVKHARNRHDRYEQIKEWAAYVRTHPDDVWGKQVNELVNAQIASARTFEEHRPDMDELRDSPLLND